MMTSELNHEIHEGTDDVLGQLKLMSAKHGWGSGKHALAPVGAEDEHKVMEVIMESKTSVCGTPHYGDEHEASSPHSHSTLQLESLISEHEQRERSWNQERQRLEAEIAMYQRQIE